MKSPLCTGPLVWHSLPSRSQVLTLKKPERLWPKLSKPEDPTGVCVYTRAEDSLHCSAKMVACVCAAIVHGSPNSQLGDVTMGVG